MRTNESEIDFLEEHRNDYLVFKVEEFTNRVFTVPIDEDFVEPKYYRKVLDMLLQANEQDMVKFVFNSNGGNVDGLISLLEGVKNTQATTVGIVIGACHSCASILALHMDELYVAESALMLCHNGRTAFAGKMNDLQNYSEANIKWINRLFDSAYEGFLEEDELQRVKTGLELYLDSEQIQERFERKREHIEAKMQALLEQEELEQQELEEKPKKRTKKKSTK